MRKWITGSKLIWSVRKDGLKVCLECSLNHSDESALDGTAASSKDGPIEDI